MRARRAVSVRVTAAGAAAEEALPPLKVWEGGGDGVVLPVDKSAMGILNTRWDETAWNLEARWQLAKELWVMERARVGLGEEWKVRAPRALRTLRTRAREMTRREPLALRPSGCLLTTISFLPKTVCHSHTSPFALLLPISPIYTAPPPPPSLPAQLGWTNTKSYVGITYLWGEAGEERGGGGPCTAQLL